MGRSAQPDQITDPFFEQNGHSLNFSSRTRTADSKCTIRIADEWIRASVLRDQFYEHFTIIIYNCRVVLYANFQSLRC